MKTHKLSFGTISVLAENMVEVVINEGVEMDGSLVDEYHKFLLTNLKKPFSILVNQKFCYSYTFEAQRRVASLDEIIAVAVISPTAARKMAMETLKSITDKDDVNIKIFVSRKEAMIWLKEQLIVFSSQTL